MSQAKAWTLGKKILCANRQRWKESLLVPLLKDPTDKTVATM